MAIPNSTDAPSGTEYGGDEVSALVLDPGYSSVRAGFAGEDVPKSIVPTHYAVLDTPGGPRYLYGENAIHNPTPGLEIRNPYSADGIVEDWERATKLWEYAISSRLTGPRQTHPSRNGLNDAEADAMEMDALDDQERPLAENPLLMTEPGWNPTKMREKYIELAMEDWGLPAFYLARAGPMAAFSAGRSSALVIDVGASSTSVTPVMDGVILKKGVTRTPLAGNFVSQQTRLVFSQAKPPIELIPHYMVTSKTAVEAGQPAQAVYKKFAEPLTPSFRRLQEERVVTEFKESVLQVWSGPVQYNEEAVKTAQGRPFEMPDGWNQVFGAERFRPTEGLFDANAALTDENNPAPKPEQTLPAIIKASMNSVDIETRANILLNVVVTGSSSLLYNFTDRLHGELTSMYPGPRVRMQAPGATTDRKYASWIGGSILASLGTFHQMWVSKKEYAEHGASIVEKRCK